MQEQEDRGFELGHALDISGIVTLGSTTCHNKVEKYWEQEHRHSYQFTSKEGIHKEATEHMNMRKLTRNPSTFQLEKGVPRQ